MYTVKTTIGFITMCMVIILLSISVGILLPNVLVKYLLSDNSRFYQDSREAALDVDFALLKNHPNVCSLDVDTG
tara:strand:- start:1395 stop:1616 length:222 start_codon:yes stop_codon:yes gene_type:complete